MPSTATAQPGTWTSIGPDAANVGQVVFDPTDPGTIYLTLGSRGVAKSSDAGSHWRTVNTGLTSLTVTSLVLNPIVPATIYASTSGGVFKSTDGGGQWRRLNASGPSEINSLAIDPLTPTRLYAATLSRGVWMSEDEAESWQAINEGLPVGQALLYLGFHSLTIDPVDPSTVYVGSNGAGAYKRTGGVWARMSADVLTPYGGARPCCRMLPIGPDPTTIYAAGTGEFYRSTDRGGSWAVVTPGPPVDVYTLAFDPLSPGTLYAGTRSGIYTSADRGDHWQPLNPDLPTVSRGIQIDPATSTFYSGSAEGLSTSTDQGRSWQRVPIGLSSASVPALAVDPVSPATLYIGSTPGGILKSEDAGGHWQAINSGFRIPSPAAVVVDPLTPSTLYALQNQVWKSTNGGADWYSSSAGMVDSLGYRAPVIVLAIDPLTPTRLYAGTLNGGIYKSVNGGDTWYPSSTGLPRDRPSVDGLFIDPTAPSTTIYANDTDSFGTFYRSFDAGESWRPMNIQAKLVGIAPLTGVLYARQGRPVQSEDILLKSVDGGGSWTTVGEGLVGDVRVLRFDPVTPTTLYAVTHFGSGDAGIFVSSDGAAHWTPMNDGLTDARVTTLAVDPLTPTTLYAGSDNAGLWMQRDASSGSRVHQPIGASPTPIPGRIEAESYDRGGQGVGYSDTTVGNEQGGFTYRTDDVDIKASKYGGYAVGWFNAGEWLAYTVHVERSGLYTVNARVGSALPDRTFHLEVDGRDVTGELAVPQLADWDEYATVTTSLMLNAGDQVIRVVMGPQDYMDFDAMEIVASSGPGSPFGGVPHPIPGKVEAEDYDLGGPGVGYSDTTPGNEQGYPVYRNDDVDIKVGNDGGFVVGWFAAGEWLAYTIDVPATGTYPIAVRAGTTLPGRTFHLEADGHALTGEVAVPQMSDWGQYATIRAGTLALTAGPHTLRLVMGPQDFMDVDAIEITAATAPGGTFGGVPHPVPGVIQAEDYDLGGQGVGYSDTTPGNEQGFPVYRNDDVDLKTSQEGGYAVGWLAAGEWLTYTVDVARSGSYTFQVRAGSALPGRWFSIEVDGFDQGGLIDVPQQSDWDQYGTATVSGIALIAGVHVFRLVMGSQDFMDLQSLAVVAEDDRRYEVITTFSGPTSGGTGDGARPNALIQGADGRLYGTTQTGGDDGFGTFFTIDRRGLRTTLHHFSAAEGHPIAPPTNESWGALIAGPDGTFYGVSADGGRSNAGAVYRIDAAGNRTTVYDFDGVDGAPSALAIEPPTGRLCGTTGDGLQGSSVFGTIFCIDDGRLTTLHTFTGGDGDEPVGLRPASDGGFYGSTKYGGQYGQGSVFRLDASGRFEVLHSFSLAEGSQPAAVVEGPDGAFYGTTAAGGQLPPRPPLAPLIYAQGTVFRIDREGTVTTLHVFRSDEPGFFPYAPLVLAPDGWFYGTTGRGGRSDAGTIFRVQPTGAFESLHEFGPREGSASLNPMIVGADGNLYGATLLGGVDQGGVVFRWRLAEN